MRSSPWLEMLVGMAGGLVLAYAALLLVLWAYARRHPGLVGLREAFRLLPDLLVFLKRVLVDRQVGRGPRLLVAVLLVYLILPVDLVPDFIPVVGYADDILVVAWVLRVVVRTAGPGALRRHWPGTNSGLRVIERLADITASTGNPDTADESE